MPEEKEEKQEKVVDLDEGQEQPVEVVVEEKETEQVVLFPEDQKIIEAIIMTRSVLRKEMRQKKNISFFLH